jgi:DNA repair and recombination protein RAD52
MIPKRTPVPNTGLNTPMTTPVQRPNLSRPQPRPPIAPADRHVTFEEPNPPVDAADGGSETIYDHDSIVFNSDDEAFLAMVELSEGNLGVPIAHEADLGRPIDFEEGAGGLDDAVGSGGRSSDVGARQADDGQQPQRAQQSHERWTGNTVNGRPQSYPPRQASHTSAPDQRLGPRQDQQRPEQYNLPPARLMAGPQATSSSSSTAPVQNRHQQQRQQSLASSSGSKQTYAEQPVAVAPKPGSTLPSALKATRPTAPSLGGFHFPPGIVSPCFF